jgi:glucose-1-phosphate adenylyltransferase
VVVVVADHVLHLDLRQLEDAHRELRADVTLTVLPVAVGEAAGRTVLGIDASQRVQEAQTAPSIGVPPSRALAPAWAGDMMVTASALPAVLEWASAAAVTSDADLARVLAEAVRLMAYDALDNRVPGARRGAGAYWHQPTTLEAYYEAHMELCTPAPPLDLYNPCWPLVAAASGFGPGKVGADAAGRAGQALDSLLCEGAMLQGGVAIHTVLGHGVVIESGAEVEDSVLLAGCRIGSGAHVRRALVGVGAVVPARDEIGYGTTPLAPARVLASGLTVVPAAAAAVPSAVSAAR